MQLIEQYRRNRNALSLLLPAWAVIHVGIFVFHFHPLLFDSYYYIQEADHLVKEGSFHDVLLFYRFYVTTLASLKLLADNYIWILIIQSIASLFVGLSFFQIVTNRFCITTGFACAIIYFLWIEMIRWNLSVMTESLFYSCACLILLQLLQFKHERNVYVRLIILTILVIFTRPTGIVLVLGVVGFLIHFHWQVLKSIVPFSKVAIPLVVTVCLLLVAYQFSKLYDFTDQYASGNLVTYMDVAKGKEVYTEHMRLDMTAIILPPASGSNPYKLIFFLMNNPVYLLKSALIKVFYLVTGIRPYYSWAHNLFTALWMLTIYVLSFVGFRGLGFKPITTFVMLTISLNCCIVGLSSVDWDNRFFLPMAPGLILLAGVGLPRAIPAVKRFVFFQPVAREQSIQ